MITLQLDPAGDAFSKDQMLTLAPAIPNDAPPQGGYPVVVPLNHSYSLSTYTAELQEFLLSRTETSESSLPSTSGTSIFARSIAKIPGRIGVSESKEDPGSSTWETLKKAAADRIWSTVREKSYTFTLAYTAPRLPQKHEQARGLKLSEGGIPWSSLPDVFLGNSVSPLSDEEKNERRAIARERGVRVNLVDSRVETERVARQRDVGVELPVPDRKTRLMPPGNCGEIDALRQAVQSGIDLTKMEIRILTVKDYDVPESSVAMPFCTTCEKVILQLVHTHEGLRIVDMATAKLYIARRTEEHQRASLDTPWGHHHRLPKRE